MSDLADLSWPRAGEALATGRAVALLPVGSTEPHGPHLPLRTDVIISVEAARRAGAALAARGWTPLILPALPYSVTDFSRDFPGAISLSRASVVVLVAEICREALRQGCAAVCLVNSHLEPEHIAALSEAAAAVSRESGKRVVFPDKTSRRWAGTLGEEFKSGACHAGRYETSLVMAAEPDLVDEHARARLPENPVSIGRMIRKGARTFREAGGDQAYFGSPAAASAAEGETLYAALAHMVVTEVLEALETAR